MFRLYLGNKLGKNPPTEKVMWVKNVELIMKYNPRLPNLDNLLKKHMPLGYTDAALKTISPKGCINSILKRNQLLKEILAPSLYPNSKVNRANSITSCNKCNICKNDLISSNYSACSATKKRYYTRGSFILVSITLSVR